MSKNAQRKRREKAFRRDQWSRFPRGTGLQQLIVNIKPDETPLIKMLKKAS